jgi:hypothetical protein
MVPCSGTKAYENFMMPFEFSTFESDPCIIQKIVRKNKEFIRIYIDCITIASKNSKFLEIILKYIVLMFEITHLEFPKTKILNFFGTASNTFLHQLNY